MAPTGAGLKVVKTTFNPSGVCDACEGSVSHSTACHSFSHLWNKPEARVSTCITCGVVRVRRRFWNRYRFIYRYPSKII